MKAKRYKDGFPIRPLSILQLASENRKGFSKNNLRHFCRVGFYSKLDGLDIIWLVDHCGEYRDTINHKFMYKYFSIYEESEIYDYYGITHDTIGSILDPKQEWIWY